MNIVCKFFIAIILFDSYLTIYKSQIDKQFRCKYVIKIFSTEINFVYTRYICLLYDMIKHVLNV